MTDKEAACAEIRADLDEVGRRMDRLETMLDDIGC